MSEKIWIEYTVSTFKMQTHTNLGGHTPGQPAHAVSLPCNMICLRNSALTAVLGWIIHIWVTFPMRVSKLTARNNISENLLGSTPLTTAKPHCWPSFALRIISALALATRNMSNFTQLLLTTPWRFSGYADRCQNAMFFFSVRARGPKAQKRRTSSMM